MTRRYFSRDVSSRIDILCRSRGKGSTPSSSVAILASTNKNILNQRMIGEGERRNRETARQGEESGRRDEQKEARRSEMGFWLHAATARIHPENGTFSWRFLACDQRKRLSLFIGRVCQFKQECMRYCWTKSERILIGSIHVADLARVIVRALI